MSIISLLSILILIFSVIIHELAHGWTAEKLGDPTARLEGRITLNPAVHIDWIGSVVLPAFLILTGAPFLFGWAKAVPFNPYYFKNPKWGGALVAIMGPISNILLALVAAAFLTFLPEASSFISYILTSIIITNLALAVFNIMPIPPLDGHHILFALIPDRFKDLKVRLSSWSWTLLLIFIFFAWKFISPVIEFLYRLIT